MTSVLATELFDWYPGSDLLPMAPPEPDETIREYCSRLAHRPHTTGDPLFNYLLCELLDIDHDEAVGYLDTAISSLFDVRAKLAERSNTASPEQGAYAKQ